MINPMKNMMYGLISHYIEKLLKNGDMESRIILKKIIYHQFSKSLMKGKKHYGSHLNGLVNLMSNGIGSTILDLLEKCKLKTIYKSILNKITSELTFNLL